MKEWMKFPAISGFSRPVIDQNAIIEEPSSVEKLQSPSSRTSLYAKSTKRSSNRTCRPLPTEFGVDDRLRPIPRFDVVINSAMKFLTVFEKAMAQGSVCRPRHAGRHMRKDRRPEHHARDADEKTLKLHRVSSTGY